MTFPIRSIPDNDTAWGSDLRAVIAAVNNHQILLTQVHVVGNSGSALNLDASSISGTIKTVTLTANCTVTFTGATSGQVATLELIVTQDATGGRLVTWPASVKWAGGAPTLSAVAGATDRLVFSSYNGGAVWYGDLVGRAYA